jgi:hypothetical protein
LENVTKQRMDLLYNDHRDTHRAIKWLKEHQEEFQSRVYLPILMSVNLKDTRYAGMFESALGGIKNSKLRVSLIFTR